MFKVFIDRSYKCLNLFPFLSQVPFPVTEIFLRMPADDDDTEFNSSQVPTSQEESTLLPSSPELSTKKKRAVTSPINVTPRRSKRVCGGVQANSLVTDDVVIAINDDTSVVEVDTEDIQQEKHYVKLIKRKTKKGQSSPVWTYDYFRIAELIDGWERKKIGKINSMQILLPFLFVTNYSFSRFFEVFWSLEIEGYQKCLRVYVMFQK
jgi:hypothetical protein